MLFLCWAGGALFALYGLTDVVAGSVRAAKDTMENAIWYAVLSDQPGCLAGCCF